MRGPWFHLSIALMAGLIVSTTSASYFYLQAGNYKELYGDTLKTLRGVSYEVDLLIDYGNGTRAWFNRTRVPIGWSLFNATLLVARSMNYTYYPQFDSYIINAIDGVGMRKDAAHSGWYWIAWEWDRTGGTWVSLEVGSSQFILKNGQVLAWHYQDTSTYPNLKPPAGDA